MARGRADSGLGRGVRATRGSGIVWGTMHMDQGGHTPGDFDEYWCVLPHVVQVTASRRHLYYTGRCRTGRGLGSFTGIGMAISDDGGPWRRCEDNPILARTGVTGSLRARLESQLKLEFHGAKVTSDAGLPAYRELDNALSRRLPRRFAPRSDNDSITRGPNLCRRHSLPPHSLGKCRRRSLCPLCSLC